MEEPKGLLAAIRGTRFRYVNEDDLQRGLAMVFQTAGIKHEREVILSPQCRIDFMVDGELGIEVKIDGSVSDLGYQVLRYLQHDSVKGVVVVTTRSGHRDLPPTLNDKPIWVVYLFTSAF